MSFEHGHLALLQEWQHSMSPPLFPCHHHYKGSLVQIKQKEAEKVQSLPRLWTMKHKEEHGPHHVNSMIMILGAGYPATLFFIYMYTHQHKSNQG